jgi:MFS family permease
MISGTYILSGVLLLITGYLFDQHQLNATTLTIAWSVVFFFASAGVSAAYLTVSEIFPMETRALAIAVFYAIGTGIGGIIGPQLFGRLIPTGKTSDVFIALVIGSALMIVGGLAEILFGVKAERQRLEGIAKPLTAVETAVRSGAQRAGDAARRTRSGSMRPLAD